MELFPELLEGNYFTIEPLQLVGNAFRRGRHVLNHLRRLTRGADRQPELLEYPQVFLQLIAGRCPSQLSRVAAMANHTGSTMSLDRKMPLFDSLTAFTNPARPASLQAALCLTFCLATQC